MTHFKINRLKLKIKIKIFSPCRPTQLQTNFAVRFWHPPPPATTIKKRSKKLGDFCPELSLSGCWRCCGGSPWKRWKQKLCSICFTWKATITKRKPNKKLEEKLCNFPAESLSVFQSVSHSVIQGDKTVHGFAHDSSKSKSC